jgi:hypothetical protein
MRENALQTRLTPDAKMSLLLLIYSTSSALFTVQEGAQGASTGQYPNRQ